MSYDNEEDLNELDRDGLTDSEQDTPVWSGTTLNPDRSDESKKDADE